MLLEEFRTEAAVATAVLGNSSWRIQSGETPHLFSQPTERGFSLTVWDQRAQLGKLPGWGLGWPGFSLSAPDFCSPPPQCLVFPDRDEFNIQVLHAFVELHEFTDLNLVQALR